MEDKNYYDILGVSEKASLEDITAAKNELAKKYHPDVNLKDGIDTTQQMQEILEAYRVLSNPDKRSEYDWEIRRKRPVMQTFDLHNMEKVIMRRHLHLSHIGKPPTTCMTSYRRAILYTRTEAVQMN